MLNRILISLFITLFAVTMIEVGYLFFYKPSSQTNNLKNVNNNFPSNINYFVFNYLNSFSRDILVSALVTSQFQGTIVKVLDRPGTENSIQYEKGLILKPVNQPGSEVQNYLLFRKTDLSALKIYQKILVIEREISFSDLKIGNGVNVEIVIDLRKDSLYNILKIKIVKL